VIRNKLDAVVREDRFLPRLRQPIPFTRKPLLRHPDDIGRPGPVAQPVKEQREMPGTSVRSPAIDGKAHADREDQKGNLRTHGATEMLMAT
jgi:hypothetical protein